MTELEDLELARTAVLGPVTVRPGEVVRIREHLSHRLSGRRVHALFVKPKRGIDVGRPMLDGEPLVPQDGRDVFVEGRVYNGRRIPMRAAELKPWSEVELLLRSRKKTRCDATVVLVVTR